MSALAILQDLAALPLVEHKTLHLLDIPKRLSREEFDALPVSPEALNSRLKIERLEAALNELPDHLSPEDDPFETWHDITGKVYNRTLHLPPGTLIVGKRHAIEHVFMLLFGEATIMTERGVEHFVAPFTFISPAGEKRVILTELGCTMVTCHATTKTTLEDIELDVIMSDAPLLEGAEHGMVCNGD
jgi:hypothetical protein